MTRAAPMGRTVAAVSAVLVCMSALAGPGAIGQPAQPPAEVALVRLPFPRDDGSLTPYTFELAYPLVTLVYDTLLLRDEAGVPQPWLARSAEVSPDGRRVTLRLADGAQWHDGTPVTSADVAFTFDHVAMHPHPRFTPQLAAVERVEAPDPSTAVVTLRQPSPGFFDQPLADLPILPAHLWRGVPRSRLAPDGLPVGSGPYRLVEHIPGKSYRFEANRAYFRGQPTVQTIEVPVIDDAEETLKALERRRVDMIPVSLPRSAAARLDRVGTSIRRGVSYAGTVLVFNLRRPPFDRAEARHAVADAIDPGRIARLVGDAVAADRGYLHPGSPWSPAQPLGTGRRSTAGAPELSASPLQVLAPENDPVKLEAARQVALALGRSNVAAAVKGLSNAEFSRAMGEDGSPASFELAVSTSPPLASYDPDYLPRVFGSDLAQAPLNEAGYSSPAFDALARRIATTPDPAGRREAVEAVLRLLADDVPVVPLFFSNGAYIVRPSVFDGWVFVKGSGILDKRSFMPAPPPAPAPRLSAHEGPASSGRSLLGSAALALVALAAVIAVIALVPRRR